MRETIAECCGAMEQLSGSLELRRNDDRGYHVVARCDIPAGSTLLHEQPLACSIADTHWRLRCRRCYAMLLDERRRSSIVCSFCKRSKYCNQACEKADLDAHRLSGECMLLGSKVATATLGVFVREVCLALRLRRARLPKLPLESHARQILESAETDPADIELVQAAVHWMTVCCGVGGGIPCKHDEALDVLGCVLTCGVELEPAVAGQGEEVRGAPSGFREHSSAVYSLASRFNHSCRPKAVYYCCPPDEICIRTIVDVSAGEEICISYTDVLDPCHSRRQSLLQKFCFECVCERCSAKGTSTRDWFLTAVSRADQSDAWAFRHGKVAAESSLHGDDSWVCIKPDVREENSTSNANYQDTKLSSEHIVHAENTELHFQKVVKDYLDNYRGSKNPLGDLCRLENHTFAAIRNGIHPFHHACLTAYSTLSSVYHVQAIRSTPGGFSPQVSGNYLWRSAVYKLVIGLGTDSLVNFGEYGPFSHVIRAWCDLAGILCECLTEECCSTRHGSVAEHRMVLKYQNFYSESELGLRSVEFGGKLGIPPRGKSFSVAIVSLFAALVSYLDENENGGDFQLLIPRFPHVIDLGAPKFHPDLDSAAMHLHKVFQRVGIGGSADSRALLLGYGMAVVLARALDFIHVAVGESHPAAETASFLPYFSGLSPPIAAGVCQAACMLRNIKQIF
ncbi:hypothetical protein BSKO_02122 [Bryopsis sp. KO-2023]|nr:hypothetical protein BSKO_02122 [Bryopsis sp. KO-2023]